MGEAIEIKNRILAQIRTLRGQAQQSEALYQSALGRLEKASRKLLLPVWAELDSGVQITAGETARYMGSVFTCVASHTKALARRPTNEEFWREVPEDG